MPYNSVIYLFVNNGIDVPVGHVTATPELIRLVFNQLLTVVLRDSEAPSTLNVVAPLT